MMCTYLSIDTYVHTYVPILRDMCTVCTYVYVQHIILAFYPINV